MKSQGTVTNSSIGFFRGEGVDVIDLLSSSEDDDNINNENKSSASKKGSLLGSNAIPPNNNSASTTRDVYVEDVEDYFLAYHSSRQRENQSIEEDITSFSAYMDDFPDIYSLFQEYNITFFRSKLSAVEVRWSKKMSLCAGLCTYQRGGYCSIRLSEPLLRYRTIKELKETLLHEMIHAFLFVTENRRDRSAHGPEFCHEMRRINVLTGLNITIYHTFSEEVDYYRRHIWRCTGSCRVQPPYFGYVKRAMNRAPGPNDRWWADHKRVCDGQFLKISSNVPVGKPKRTGFTTSKKTQQVKLKVSSGKVQLK